MKFFEIKSFICAVVLVVIGRIMIAGIDKNILADGNFLILVIFPVFFIMAVMNIVRFCYVKKFRE